MIKPQSDNIPGNLTPYLVPIHLTNQDEAQKSVISYAQQRTQENLLTEFHDISRGMQILKCEMKKMDTRFQELTLMRDTIASQLSALRLEITDAQNAKKSELPTQETLTEMELVSEQEAAISTLTIPNEPVQQP